MAGMVGHIDWVYLNLANVNEVNVGELISAEAGGLPIYKVMALREGRVWVKDLQDGSDRVAPISVFHWKALLSATA